MRNVKKTEIEIKNTTFKNYRNVEIIDFKPEQRFVLLFILDKNYFAIIMHYKSGIIALNIELKIFANIKIHSPSNF